MRQKNLKTLIFAFFILLIFGIGSGHADPSCMRCSGGYKMVCIGNPASTVIARCGSPDSIAEIGSKTKSESSGTIRRSRYQRNVYHTRSSRSSTELKLEEWTYCIRGSYGNDCYLYILRFKGDKLVKITSTQERGN